jgi:threonine/homoserine/homoserine lactone efflux protein
MSPIWEGLILGLTLAFFFGFGPALFALIQTSIHRGLWSGFLLAFGIFVSDLFLVALCFLGAIKILSQPLNHLIFGIISGVVLIIFGIATYRKEVHIENPDNEDSAIRAPHPIMYILKGFFLNVANPFVWIFWMGVVVGITANYVGDNQSVILFFSTTLLTVLATDLLKCFGSYKIKKFITSKFIQWVNRTAGIGLFAFGIFLIVRVILES